MYMGSKTSLNQCIFYTSNLHYSDRYHISKCSTWKVAQKYKRGWKTVSSKLTTICIDFFQPCFLLGSNLGAFSCGIFGSGVSQKSQKSYFWNTPIQPYRDFAGHRLFSSHVYCLVYCAVYCFVLWFTRANNSGESGAAVFRFLKVFSDIMFTPFYPLVHVPTSLESAKGVGESPFWKSELKTM